MEEVDKITQEVVKDEITKFTIETFDPLVKSFNKTIKSSTEILGTAVQCLDKYTFDHLDNLKVSDVMSLEALKAFVWQDTDGNLKHTEGENIYKVLESIINLSVKDGRAHIQAYANATNDWASKQILDIPLNTLDIVNENNQLSFKVNTKTDIQA